MHFADRWSTNRGETGSWIRLTWGALVTKIVPHDRPNSDDQVLLGTLRFSDNTIASVDALDNLCGPTVITSEPKTITSVHFAENSVSAYEIGSVEFEVYSA